VQVGTSTPLQDKSEDESCNTWSLPKRLISHYSPFLEAAGLRNFKERQEKRIELPDDDAIVFSLFVEWMYYGDYSIAPLSLPPPSTKLSESISIDARCWILGDKLLCNEFKNHAMNRLYKQHTAVIFGRAVTTHEVRYVCNNTASSSRLRELYVALVATNFSRRDRVLGSTDEWDELLLEHADMRSLLLQSLRVDDSERDFVQGKQHHMEEVGPSL
jgi:hypothetical protein